jgi:hypothetical protein
MAIKVVKIKNPNNLNLIFGQSHFIKTVEDLHEAIISAVPGAKFGLAFAEASGPCLIRASGTNKELEKLAAENILKIGAGHSFLIFLENLFPINVLPAIKNLAEVCQIFCATANPVAVVLYQTKQEKAVLGIVDGQGPKGIEKDNQVKERKDFLRKIGYKL